MASAKSDGKKYIFFPLLAHQSLSRLPILLNIIGHVYWNLIILRMSMYMSFPGASAFKKVPLGASDNLQGDVMTQLEIPPSLVNKLVKGEPIIRRVPPAECSPQQVTTGSTFTTTGHKSLPPPPYTSSPNDPYADIHILHNEIPPEHRAGYFDFVFSFAEADEEMARNVIQIFKDHVRYGANEPPQICVINRRDEFSWIQSQFKSAQEAMERSTYMVIILTKNYIEDKWSVMVQEAMLWETLISLEKQWCIIPLFLTRKSELDFKIPFGLGPLKGIELPRMFSPPAASIGDIDFGNIHKENLDRYFLKNMAMMLNNKVRIRREKEKEGQRKKDRWLKEEKRRRWKKREQEKIMQEKELEDDWKRDAEAQRQVNQLRQEPSHAPPTYTEVSKENRLPQERDIQSLQASRQIHFHLPNGYSGPLPDMKTVFNVQEVHHGAFGDNAQVMVQNSLVEVGISHNRFLPSHFIRANYF